MKTLLQEVRDASIALYKDSGGSEDLRYLDEVNDHVRRFNQLITAAFKVEKSSDELKAAHLAIFHLVSPHDLQAALKEHLFRVGDRTYLDWTTSDTLGLQRRAINPLTVIQLSTDSLTPEIQWSAFCNWLTAMDGYRGLSIEDALHQLRCDQIAWGIKKLPLPLFAHVVGIRAMRPLSRITLGRQLLGKVPRVEIDEKAIDREAQVAELIDVADESANLSLTNHDEALIKDALSKLTTTQNETADQHIDRWVRELISRQNKSSRASFFGLLVLAWMADVCESGTVSKVDSDFKTRARYPKVSAQPILQMISKLGSDPATWKSEALENGCRDLMNDESIGDKSGLGAGISSFLQFVHENWGAPLVGIGIHKLIPPPRPRVQFVSETEILRAIRWTSEQKGSDDYLLKIVRVCLAVGWSAPFRIQELLNLRVGNISPLPNGGYEIEIVPKRGGKLKTPAATRRVTVKPGWAAEHLKEWLALRAHQSASARCFLFGTDTEQMSVYRKHAVRNALLHLLKATTGDIGMTFHALRHSWASIEVSKILSTSSVVNYDRLIHIADAMGHVSPASTLYFYSHISEDALALHLSYLIREVLGVESSEAVRLLQMKPNTVRQAGLRKHGWTAEVSLWQQICESAAAVDLPDCSADQTWVEPICPQLGKGFVRSLTPASVLTILIYLQEDLISSAQIAAACRVSTEIVEDIRTKAIELSRAWLHVYKKPGQDIPQIESVDGAVLAMRLNLNSALKKKYASLLLKLSVGLDVPGELISAWLQLRKGVYLSALPATSLNPLLKLFKQAGLAANEFKVAYQSEPDSPHSTLTDQAQIALQFRSVWGVNPEFIAREFHHEHRTDAYLVFPGDGKHGKSNTSSFSTVRGIHALLFATCIYSRMKGPQHGAA